MNNIYKVIWSKAKNCYVVASEIARSHTKSATGSEKIGGVTRRSLLASLMALSLLCGGLGVAEAAVVHVNEDVSGTSAVYTTDETYTKTQADDRYATKTELNAKGEAIATNTANIATNKDDITKLENNKLSKDVASATYATNKALNDLNTVVNGKADESVVEAALVDKADKTYVDTKLEDYAKSDDVYTKTAADGKFATSAALNTAKTDLEGEITTAKNELDGKITANTTKINANETAIQKLNAKAGTTETTLNDLSDRMVVAENNITDLKNADVRLEGKINQNANDITGLKDKDVELSGKINDNKNLIDQNKTNIAKNAADITNINGKLTTAEGNIQTNTDNINALDKKVGTINNGTYLDGTASVADNLGKLDAGLKQEVTDRKAADDALSGRITANANTIAKVNQELVNTNNHFNTELRKTNAALQAEGQTRANADAALAKDITATNKRTAGIGRTDTGVEADNQTVIEGKVHFDQNGNVSGVKDLQTDTIHATGKITSEGLDAGSGEITTKGKVSAGDVSTGTLETTGNATIGGNLDVTGTLNIKDVTAETIHISKSEDNADYKSEGSIIGDGGKLSVSNEKTDKRTNITEKSELNVNEKGTVNWATSTDNATGNVTEGRSEVTADNIKNSVKKTEGGKTFGYEENITADGKGGTVTDKAGNTTYTKVTATENSFQVQDKDGKNKNHQVNTKDSSVTEITNGDGKTTKTEQTATDIKNTAKDGTITNEAKDIVNTATTMKTTVTGKATESYGELETTVDGQATENFNGGLDTNVTGKENHTVTGDQNIHVTGKQTNEIGGNQENTIGGSQTTTVTGKVTENYKAGQGTNVTGDQTTNVSGTQTTTATDINRNASSGMIDTIDNAYGTNTETKVAGETKTEVSIKGTGEKGEYIRGATESRDYIIKGTLTNTETKTAEATSSEITDGTNKASTKQDAKNLAGSVTNGTETGVSGIHANKDGSVSIDSAVSGEGGSSVINQKKDSITSSVGNADGSISTVIRQDKDNVIIASSNGTVAIGGKDIVNNASENITNTAKNITNAATETLTDKVGDNTRVTTSTSITDTVGATTNRKIEDGKITDTAGDSTVTTENGKGTTFAKAGSTAVSTEAGAPTDTNIAGNLITTGRVDANELGVSDKDGDNTADFSVKAGEGVKASAGNGTTTGSLDVKADEVSSSVKDASGKGSTFKQRIDAIMMESKDVSIKAEEKLTNEAKVITNKASEVINNEAVNINNTATGIITSKASEIQNQADKLISNKVGENTWENMEDGKITTSIKNGKKQNLTQSDAEKTEHSVVNGSNSTVNKQTSKEITDAVTNGTTTNVTQNTATSSNNTIADTNGNANTVVSTVKGTKFTNTGANTAIREGTVTDTTITGNTITTGKVTMDYAEVMKDLGVTGKTTTGSLEVKGESKLTGNVTMENNATVGNDLNVNGITKTKTLNVTEDASVGRNLTVGGNATIAGDVTARSYKVDGKTYIDANGIHANNQKITNVADGSISEGSKDAVNGGQLYTVKNDLEGKVNKVGANAAAMANLHPMEFDPDSKWNIAAAIGNYGSETAAALGAFYRPNDDVMVNLSTAFGTGENMVGGGVSVRLGKGGNKLSREESNALKAQVDDLTARMDALLSVLNPNMSKDFPDVPENHWAYEAVSRLAGNDIVQGYPDGEFHGERTMTRYEMAEIIYNALSRGAEAERELVEEFKPELQAMAASEKATAERAEG